MAGEVAAVAAVVAAFSNEEARSVHQWRTVGHHRCWSR
jgi:hypothetical protein